MTAIASPSSASLQMTPEGRSEDENIIRQLSQEAYLHFQMQQANVREAINDIETLLELKSGWDGEEASPISYSAASLARDIVLRTARLAAERGIRWLSPSISPTPDGGVDLFWQVGTRRVLLIIEPQHEDVECVIKIGDSAPQIRLISYIDASQVALWAIAVQPTS